MKKDYRPVIMAIVMFICFFTAIALIVYPMLQHRDAPCLEECSKCLEENVAEPTMVSLWIPSILFAISGWIFMYYFMPIGGI